MLTNREAKELAFVNPIVGSEKDKVIYWLQLSAFNLIVPLEELVVTPLVILVKEA